MLLSFPSTSDIDAAAHSAGLRLEHVGVVREEAPDNWADYVRRVSHRADSLLQGITDEAFHRGLATLRDMCKVGATGPHANAMTYCVLSRANGK